MISLERFVRIPDRLNRLGFLGSLILVVVVYVVVTFFVADRLYDFGSIGHLALNSVFELILSIIFCILAVGRLKDIGISKAWSMILFFPWLFGLDNMFLIDYYFNDSKGISQSVTYSSIFLAFVGFALLLYLLVKSGQQKEEEIESNLDLT